MATTSYYEAIGLLAICDAIDSVEGVPLTSFQQQDPPKPQLPASLKPADRSNIQKAESKNTASGAQPVVYKYGAPYPYPPPAPPGYTDSSGFVQHPYLSHPLTGHPMPPPPMTAYGYPPNQPPPYPVMYPQPGFGGPPPAVPAFPAPGTPGTPGGLQRRPSYNNNIPAGTSPAGPTVHPTGNTTPGGAIPSALATPAATISANRPRSDSVLSDSIYKSEDCPVCGRNFKGPKASTHKQQHIRRLHPEDYTPKRGGKKRILLDGVLGGGGERLQYSSLAQAATNPY